MHVSYLNTFNQLLSKEKFIYFFRNANARRSFIVSLMSYVLYIYRLNSNLLLNLLMFQLYYKI